MVPELEILELCDPPKSYDFIERTVFHGDRTRLLRALRHLGDAGHLAIRIGGKTVPAWQIDFWARNPAANETERDLIRVTLETTTAGRRCL